MSVKQLSIFVENKSGRIAEISRILGGANVNIRALSIADTTDFGILRVIVDDPDKAKKVCRDAGLMIALTDVLAIKIEDKPGGFASAMQILADNEISVEYMYAFLTPGSDKYACVIISTADIEKAKSVLLKYNIAALDEKAVYSL